MYKKFSEVMLPGLWLIMLLWLPLVLVTLTPTTKAQAHKPNCAPYLDEANAKLQRHAKAFAPGWNNERAQAVSDIVAYLNCEAAR